MESDRQVALAGGTALLGDKLTPIENATVVLQDDRIAAAGPRTEVEIPAAAETIDVSGRLVCPGFIDAHVHIGFYDPRDVVIGGITAARDLGWPPDRIWPLVAASEERRFEGPLLVAAGQMLTAPGGYPTRAPWAPEGTGRAVADPGDASDAVNEQLARGAACIKVALNPPVGPVLDRDVLGAVIDAAHARGAKVTGHISGLEELEKAIEVGIDELAHMLMSAERIPDALLQTMAERNIAVVPTLSIFPGKGARAAVENLARFVAAGGRVIYGTDLGNAGPRPGIDPTEIDRMAGAGMNPRDIIASATSQSAGWLDLERKGNIAEGFDADIVVLDGGALDDHRSLSRVQMVFRLGRRVR